MNTRILNSFGILAPLWLLIGVSICAALYPGYSHLHQAMSELHAIGSPVAEITPLINHYPLTLLFIGFGISVYRRTHSKLAGFSAVMIMLHGLATFFAGYFQCDIGCNPESTLTSQLIHGVAGITMLLTFLIAPAVWGYVAKSELNKVWFGWISISCVILQIAIMPLIGEALETGLNFGLYQRIAYGLPLLWMLLLSITLRKG